MKEISDLVDKKATTITPEELKKETEEIQNKIQELKKTLTKDNEFSINSQINYLTIQQEHLQNIVNKKQKNTETVQEISL